MSYVTKSLSHVPAFVYLNFDEVGLRHVKGLIGRSMNKKICLFSFLFLNFSSLFASQSES